jgi:excisionase family DNA binding protein
MTLSQIPNLLSTRQVAALLGVGGSSVKRWADRGLLACVKTVGGQRRFEPEVVDAFRRVLGRTGARSDGATPDADGGDSAAAAGAFPVSQSGALRADSASDRSSGG